MWLSWLLLVALSLGLEPVAYGDDTFCFPTGNCYTVNTTAVNFDKAKMTCGLNGSLASMKNQEEKQEIVSLVTKFQEQRSISNFWLGLYLPACIVRDKKLYGFAWLSGEEETEISEWNRIPTQSCTTKRKCVILESRKNSTIRPLAVTLIWKDVRCDRKFPSICRSNGSAQDTSDAFKMHTSEMSDLSSSPRYPVSPNTDLHSPSSTFAPRSEDDNLLDRLIIPLILGLVAFGILVMLIWGGAQMCFRKRKPKRRKSIIPAPPEASDTDSTDHSSSDEDDDDDDDEEGDGESQDRTQDP